MNPDWPFPAGLHDQLAYYSNYGSRVDIAAPGGSRAFNVPDYDATDGDVFTDRFGVFGGDATGPRTCATLLGTAASSPRATRSCGSRAPRCRRPKVSGAVARLFSAQAGAEGQPGRRPRAAAGDGAPRHDERDRADEPEHAPPHAACGPASPGFCHISTTSPISFADAYGAGIVDVGAAVH